MDGPIPMISEKSRGCAVHWVFTVHDITPLKREMMKVLLGGAVESKIIHYAIFGIETGNQT